MFEFLVLPFLIADISKMGFNDLPVEVAASIFRRLDSESLVKAARTCQYWMRIICGDPILAKRLFKQIKKEERQRREALLHPGLRTQVVRKDPPKMYSANFTKIVRFGERAFRLPQRTTDVIKSEVRPFSVVESSSKKRKMKNEPVHRSKPRKCMRF